MFLVKELLNVVAMFCRGQSPYFGQRIRHILWLEYRITSFYHYLIQIRIDIDHILFLIVVQYGRAIRINTDWREIARPGRD